jgi:nucleotide-binding universal stress UspA family protein
VLAIGADGADAALAFAVAEARRTARPLHLVHVLQVPAGEAYLGLYEGMLDAARSTLDEATKKASALAAGVVPVSAELLDKGWVVDDLVSHTYGASMLVLQHRDLSKIKRVFVGSVAQSVAGRASVPVVSVPECWRPRIGTDNVVTAATQDPVEAPALLRAGFEEARSRGARLVVLHAWWLASGYDVVVVDDAVRATWTERSSEELAPVLAPLRAEFPDIQVSVTVRHAPPVDAVLDAGKVSDLLVLGRRHHLLPLGSHLGPITRAALDRASCPVLITPEVPVPVPARDPQETVPGHLATSVA